MMSGPQVLGIFPAPDHTGGVQASGAAAWMSVAERAGVQNTKLFTYSPGASRLATVVRAVTARCRPHLVLVWHLDLVKLVPLLSPQPRRLMVFLHGIEAWRRQDPMTRRVLQGVRLFLSNSQHTWEQFVACNPEFGGANHCVVHLGIGTRLASPPSPSASPIALVIGRMAKTEDYKGHRELIQAWPTVLRRIPQAQLWIVGGGDLRPSLEQLVATIGITESVRFWGAVPDTEKDRLIGNSRCLALPSRGEGFGLVYLEAMRIGRPCLVSDLDAGREVVNPPEAGLAVNPADRTQVADAICTLLANGPEWEAFSIRARRRYDCRFTADHFRERLTRAVFAHQ